MKTYKVTDERSGEACGTYRAASPAAAIRAAAKADGYSAAEVRRMTGNSSMLARYSTKVIGARKANPCRCANPSRKKGRKPAAARRKAPKRKTNPDTTPAVGQLRRVRLNSGGYEPGKYGQYFGHGAPLYAYEVETADDLYQGYVRGGTRDSAKANVMVELRPKHLNIHFAR